jgi:DNA polymerase-3 subunit delta
VAALRVVVCDDEVEAADVAADARRTPPGLEAVHLEAVDRGVGELANEFAQVPMFAEGRRVIVTGLGGWSARDLVDLVEAASGTPGPNEIVIVLIGDPAASVVSRAGAALEDRRRPRADRRRAAVANAFHEAGLALAPGLVETITETLGQDVSRARGLARTLVTLVGEGGVVDEEALGAVALEPGGRPPWELTDAIEAGDPSRALAVLDALLAAGTPVSLLLALIERRVLEFLAVAGTGAREAAAVNAALMRAGLRTRPDFAARVLAERAAALGPERAARFVALLADAERDLRGGSLAREETVLNILVARLASLMPPGRPRSGAASRGAPPRGRPSAADSRLRGGPPSARPRG